MKPLNYKRNISDSDDFNDYASEMYQEYLQTFTIENGLIRKMTENDYGDPDWEYIYTTKGMRLAERMKDRLIEVGKAHFPSDYIEIDAGSYLIEY